MLGLGGAPIGFSADNAETAVDGLIRRAVDLGVTFFDTAPDYRRSEELLGRALRGRRSEVVLATKVGRLQTLSARGWDVREDWTEAGVRATIERSLRRLQTDYLDLVQLHSPPREVLDDGAALGELLRAQRDGTVRHIGISADGDVARRALALGVFATLQASYSVLQQEPGSDVLPTAAAAGVGIVAKQPLANAIPAMPRRPHHPDWSWKWVVAQRLDWAPADSGAARLDLALRWVLARPIVSTAIVGTTRLEHLERNVAVALAPSLDEATVGRFARMHAAARSSASPTGHGLEPDGPVGGGAP